MVAVPTMNTTNLKKVPSLKADWILSYKSYFEKEAAALGVLRTLQGLDKSRTYTQAQINAQRKPSIVASMEQANDKVRQRKAIAWKLLYDVTEGTNLTPIIQPFEESKNVKEAYNAIINFYEQDYGSNHRLHLENSLDNVHVPKDLPLNLAFKSIVCEFENICVQLTKLPPDTRIIIDDKTKKLKLHRILVKSSRFDIILAQSSTSKADYDDFKVAVEKEIDHFMDNEALKKEIKSVEDLKVSNSRNESTVSQAVNMADVDVDILNTESLNALKTQINRNRTKIVKAIKRKQQEAGLNSQNDTSSTPPNERPSTWHSGRGGRSGWRGNAPFKRYYGRGNNYRGRSYSTYNSSYTSSRPSQQNQNNTFQSGPQQYPNNHSFSNQRGGRFGGRNSSRGGRGGRFYSRYNGGFGSGGRNYYFNNDTEHTHLATSYVQNAQPHITYPISPPSFPTNVSTFTSPIPQSTLYTQVTPNFIRPTPTPYRT
jgi:hypothetical protein